MKNSLIRTGTILFLIQIQACFLSCSEEPGTVLDKEFLDKLFQDFSPRYNYTTEPTVMQALTGGELFKEQSTFYLMVTPDDGYHYGLGMFISETARGTAYGHSGAFFGYNTRLEYFPDDDALVIPTMSFNGYDFMVTKWYEDYCYRIIDEIRRAGMDR